MYLMTGGDGKLGTELQKHLDCSCPTEKEMDIVSLEDVVRFIDSTKPSAVIHCAAMTDVSGCEKYSIQAYDVNVIGTFNIARVCASRGIKMIYISTDHVFDGYVGYYDESDLPNPTSVYAKSKLMGEWIVGSIPNNLIIRTSFMKDFPFEKAYVDKHFSAERVETIAEWIATAVKKDLVGLYHIAGKPKSVYDLAKRFNPKVKRMSLKNRPTNDYGMPYLRNTVLMIDKWKGEIE